MMTPVGWSLAITPPDHLAFERPSVFADENADDSACRNHQVIWLREFRKCGSLVVDDCPLGGAGIIRMNMMRRAQRCASVTGRVDPRLRREQPEISPFGPLDAP